MEYMRWAKVHRRVRYELTDSGLSIPDAREFGAGPADIDLVVKGAYGDPQLISAVAKRYRADPDGVVLVPGASSANFIALASALKNGDTVLIEHPVYEPIERAAEFLGLRAEFVHRRPNLGFGIQIEDIREGLNRGARAVMLTNLHNPSGQLITIDAIKQIAECCNDMSAWLIVDEAYLDATALSQGGQLWTASTVAQNAVATGSLTKIYGLGGLRMGWILASPELAERARTIMDVLSVNNAAPASALALRAFSQIDRLEDRFRRIHREGHPVFCNWLVEQSLLTGYSNHGAIFECLNLPNGMSSVQLNELLAAEYDTQVVPGRFFGLDDHIRLSLTLPPSDLTEALSRITSAVDRLVDQRP